MSNRFKCRLALRYGVVASGWLFAASWLAIGHSGSANATPPLPGLSHMSAAAGQVLNFDPASEPLVRAAERSGVHVANVRELGQAGQSIIYSVGTAPGCYATGSGLNSAPQISQLVCSDEFPSPAQPVIALVKTRTEGASDPGVASAEGVAADAIVTVELRDSAGNVVESSGVTDNVFDLAPVAAADVSSFAALDGAGDVVYSTAA